MMYPHMNSLPQLIKTDHIAVGISPAYVYDVGCHINVIRCVVLYLGVLCIPHYAESFQPYYDPSNPSQIKLYGITHCIQGQHNNISVIIIMTHGSQCLVPAG